MILGSLAFPLKVQNGTVNKKRAMTVTSGVLFLGCLFCFMLWSTFTDIYNRIQWFRADTSSHVKQARNFFTASREGEAKVETFYASLEDLKSQSNKSDTKFHLHQHVSFSQFQVKDLLKQLYSLDDMWDALTVDGDREDVRDWAHLLSTTFQAHYCKLTHSWQLCGDPQQKVRQVTQMFHELLKYSDVLRHYKELQVDGKFMASLFECILHWSAQEGLLPAFLVFAHLFPDMVCDECYPVLNNDTDVYQQLVTYESVATYQRFIPLLQKYEEYVIL